MGNMVSNDRTKKQVERIILMTLFAIYLLALFRITVFRGSGAEVYGVNLVPFKTIEHYLWDLLYGHRMAGVSNILGNVAIFLPMGFISAVLFQKMRRLGRIMVMSFLISSFIEVLQYVLSRGTADIDDIILNTFGGMIGFGIFSFMTLFFRKRNHSGAHPVLRGEIRKYAIVVSGLMIVITLTGMFAVGGERLPFDGPVPGGIIEKIDNRLERLGGHGQKGTGGQKGDRGTERDGPCV